MHRLAELVGRDTPLPTQRWQSVASNRLCAGGVVAARRLADLRKAAGYTQESFVDAFASMANSLAIDAAVSVRQLRRWESPNPPLPHPGQQAVIEALLGVPLTELGFTVPPERARHGPAGKHGQDVDHRHFDVDVGAIVGASVLPVAQDLRIVTFLRSRVSDLYTIDHSQGGKVAQRAAVQVLRQVEIAVTDGSYLERIGRSLHLLSGTLHSHLGWIEFDAGARCSLTWHDRADKATEAPRWTAFAGQVEIDYATAAWHVQTGRPAHAIPFLRSALKQLGPTYSRNAALYRARLAEVLLEAGEVEEACAEALASASAAQGMASARLVDRLGAVASSAERIGTAPARDFVARVRAFGVRVESGRRA
ncbi:hypothetical protein ACIBCA_34280 [Kitasatospora sp. NPDC051170]|uniref:hypothetical protein n=1 Tax=Kitasatospora sp. NPDC051170 TaxID=3364056 RepID=UPI0037AD0BB2